MDHSTFRLSGFQLRTVIMALLAVMVGAEFNANAQSNLAQFTMKPLNTDNNFVIFHADEIGDGNLRMIAYSGRTSDYDSAKVHLMTFNPSMELLNTISLLPERRFGNFVEVLPLEDGYLMAGQLGFSTSSWRGVVSRLDHDGELRWSRTYSFSSTPKELQLAQNGEDFIAVLGPSGSYSDRFQVMVESLTDTTHADYGYYWEDADFDYRVTSSVLSSDNQLYITFQGQDYAGLLVKLNENMGVEWTRRFELEVNGSVFSPSDLHETSDGNIRFIYNNNVETNQGDKPTLMEFDPDGNLIFAKRYSIGTERFVGALTRVNDQYYIPGFVSLISRGHLFSLNQDGSVNNVMRSDVQVGFNYGRMRMMFGPIFDNILVTGSESPGLQMLQLVPDMTSLCRHSDFVDYTVEDVNPAISTINLVQEPFDYSMGDLLAFELLDPIQFLITEECESPDNVTSLDDELRPVVHPNPASDYIQFTHIQGYTNLTMMDSRGVIVYQKSVRGYEKIDLAGLAQGIYTWQLQAKGDVHTGKLVVQ